MAESETGRLEVSHPLENALYEHQRVHLPTNYFTNRTFLDPD
jgi:hypothetical protein